MDEAFITLHPGSTITSVAFSPTKCTPKPPPPSRLPDQAISIENLSSIVVKTRQSFPSFGGVMLWDVSQAYGFAL